jgi:hypothetical protein
MEMKRIVIVVSVPEDTDIFDVHEEIEGLDCVPEDLEEAAIVVYENEAAYLAENEIVL